MVDKKKDTTELDVFINIIDKAYQGSSFQYGKETFRLAPTLVRPADFHRKPCNAKTSYEHLLNALDPAFKTLATSEVYRADTGWIAKGVNGYKGYKIRQITVGEEAFLLPNISKQPTVGIDTSGYHSNTDTIIIICSIPDPDGAYLWLEKHLKLPKDLQNNEFHWSKLKHKYKRVLLDNFELVLAVCCDCLLAIKSNILFAHKGKMGDVFANLVEGCFSGFENVPNQAEFRANLKQRFFRAVNRVEVHCDDDFTPLAPDKVVRLLVQTLAKHGSDYFESYTPLFATLYSHESKSIQIADIIAGMIKTVLESKETTLLNPLPFDARKLYRQSKQLPKAYFWVVGEYL
ncbi:MAG: hypothetical protein FWH37_02690 [Candidatus Bathyarchaeota archaeon]|nr:hypothetical protein [Candidatus Termiticorpusculum sp.]